LEGVRELTPEFLLLKLEALRCEFDAGMLLPRAEDRRGALEQYAKGVAEAVAKVSKQRGMITGAAEDAVEFAQAEVDFIVATFERTQGDFVAGGPSAAAGGGLLPQVVAGGSGEGGTSTGAASVAEADGSTCVLDAVIYDVRVPVEGVGRVDVRGLAKAAANAGDFEKALAELGKEQRLYHISRPVDLTGDRIEMITETPYITGAHMVQGRMVSTVATAPTGVLLQIAGAAQEAGKMDLVLTIQVSGVSEGAQEISGNEKAPNFRRVMMDGGGPAEVNKPFLVMGFNSDPADADGQAVAYIARVVLERPALAARATSLAR
jgi:hypothetical protein